MALMIITRVTHVTWRSPAGPGHCRRAPLRRTGRPPSPGPQIRAATGLAGFSYRPVARAGHRAIPASKCTARPGLETSRWQCQYPHLPWYASGGPAASRTPAAMVGLSLKWRVGPSPACPIAAGSLCGGSAMARPRPGGGPTRPRPSSGGARRSASRVGASKAAGHGDARAAGSATRKKDSEELGRRTWKPALSRALHSGTHPVIAAMPQRGGLEAGTRGLMVKASVWQSIHRQSEPCKREAFMAAPSWCGLVCCSRTKGRIY
jgi:hypothetical protein